MTNRAPNPEKRHVMFGFGVESLHSFARSGGGFASQGLGCGGLRCVL